VSALLLWDALPIRDRQLLRALAFEPTRASGGEFKDAETGAVRHGKVLDPGYCRGIGISHDDAGEAMTDLLSRWGRLLRRDRAGRYPVSNDHFEHWIRRRQGRPDPSRQIPPVLNSDEVAVAALESLSAGELAVVRALAFEPTPKIPER